MGVEDVEATTADESYFTWGRVWEFKGFKNNKIFLIKFTKDLVAIGCLFI